MLADVPADARILKEEVFGPVAPITGFDTEEEGAAANDTEYGLAAYITPSRWTGRCGGEGMEAGMVGVNRGDLRPRRTVRWRQTVRFRARGTRASRSTSTRNTSR